MVANAIFGQGSSEKVLCNKQDLTRQKARAKGVQGKVEGSRSVVLYITFYYSTHKKSLPPCKWKMGWGTGGEISWAILRAIACREKEGQSLQHDLVFVPVSTSRIFFSSVVSFCPLLQNALVLPATEIWVEGTGFQHSLPSGQGIWITSFPSITSQQPSTCLITYIFQSYRITDTRMYGLPPSQTW